MNFKDFLSTFDTYLEYENLFSSHYYGYVNNVFVEKKLLYPILIYHTDAMSHTILDNSITVLKFNFFVFDKLKTDNSNIIDVQDDLLKKLVKIQSYLKRKFFATNFNITAISDEAYSEKITGWIMDCLIKLDTSEATCIDMRERYLVDGISKYDRQTYTIIECLLPSGSEAVFPNYTYFLDDYRNPVDKITLNIFQNIKFTGDFKMNNLEIANDYEFTNSIFNGIFSCDKVETIGIEAFRFSQFNGSFNCPNLTSIGNFAFELSVFTGYCTLPVCESIGRSAFRLSKFTGVFNCPNLTSIGDNAFLNSVFDTITIGANANLGTGCIGAHSAEFIADYTANNKLAGTYVWDSNTQHWIYQN